MPHQARIDSKLIDHLSDLARLEVPPDRREELRTHLARIVASFSALHEASLECDSASAIRTASSANLRGDEPEQTDRTERVLDNAPQRAAECFVVPRVVDA